MNIGCFTEALFVVTQYFHYKYIGAYEWELGCELINSGIVRYGTKPSSIQVSIVTEPLRGGGGCGTESQNRLLCIAQVRSTFASVSLWMEKFEQGRIHTSVRLLYFRLNWRRGAIRDQGRVAKYTFSSRQVEIQQFRVVCLAEASCSVVNASFKGLTPSLRTCTGAVCRQYLPS
jgi:hypothetical protein